MERIPAPWSIRPITCSTRSTSLYGLTFGAIVGAPSGMLLHVLQGRRRDFASLRSTQRAGTRSSWTGRSPTGLYG
ncbi:hypothetical protein ACWDDN_38020 [Streptomyces griseoruber]|uniref:hypothetical protein n=1 Tax=Streptomyces griseoruber TaxID=1943 RepID=UPI001F0AF554|nr:hypothetical protein [Streptomyces griseoruber]